MRKQIQTLLGRFTFCVGIGTDQLTPEIKTISWWVQNEIYEGDSSNMKFIKPKMFNVKPQPFSVQIKDKRKKK
jgi:hypothetical protein